MRFVVSVDQPGYAIDITVRARESMTARDVADGQVAETDDVLTALTTAYARAFEEVQERLGEGKKIEVNTSDQPSITCPVCGMTSYNPRDVKEGYCGNCYEWTSPPGSEAACPACGRKRHDTTKPKCYLC